jgi:hypothetical protein
MDAAELVRMANEAMGQRGLSFVEEGDGREDSLARDVPGRIGERGVILHFVETQGVPKGIRYRLDVIDSETEKLLATGNDKGSWDEALWAVHWYDVTTARRLAE